jgi:hypothetical protein
MKDRVCRYCGQKFRPSRYHPDQLVCSSAQCQLRRRTDYHRRKLIEDPVYREQCLDSQRKWRAKNPQYMKRYWTRRRAHTSPNGNKRQLTSELHHLLELVENNLAFDLRSLDASIWLVGPNGLLGEKNNLASAKIIILQGIESPSTPQRTSF